MATSLRTLQNQKLAIKCVLDKTQLINTATSHDQKSSISVTKIPMH